MKEIKTEIEINASAEKVWQVLTDFAHFHDWNPFIREIIGTVSEGSKLEISIGSGVEPTVNGPAHGTIRVEGVTGLNAPFAGGE